MTLPLPTFANQIECELFLKEILAENVLIPKKSPIQFALVEIFSFAAQFLVFFLGIVLTTDLLKNEKKLMATLTSKVGDGAMHEFVLVGLAILAVVGALGLVAEMFDGTAHLVRDFMLEFPKAIYAFAASAAASFAAVERFLQLNPLERSGNSSYQLIGIAVSLALLGLLYGGILSFMLRRKEYIK